jgi:Putative adhesin
MASLLSPPRRTLLAAGVVFSVVVIAFAVLSVVSWLGRSSYEKDTVISPQAQRLSVRTGGGQVALAASTDGRVHVHSRVRYGLVRPTLTEQSNAEGVRLEAGCRGWFGLGFSGCEVDYTVAAPPNFTVEVRSGGGEIRARDLAGDVSLSTGGGDIDVSGNGGTLSMTSGGGTITTSGLRGPVVQARTGGGSVELSFTYPPGRVSADSGGGDVNVAVPGGPAYQVDAGTGGGETTIDVRTDPQAERVIHAHSGGGDVHVYAVNG